MGASDLAGTGVLVTRPAHQADRLVRLIEEAGGRAIRFPVIEIAEPIDNALLLAIVDRLERFDLAIFISPNAVEKAMNLVRARRRGWPENVTVACVGRGSARALRHFGMEHAITPAGRFDSEALLAEPALADIHGKRIVIFRGDGGRELLGNTLRERGADVEYAECYRRVRPAVDPTPLLRRWARGEIDIVTVTSVDALRNLYDMVGKAGRSWLVRTPLVVLAESHAEACRELGFKHAPIVAREASDEAILEAIQAWRAG
ncbi:uroporphyrinogen III synthase [Sulfurifustis variabilis]|uniref:Uroporphyrinogen-III synthase n=1 Tax=Sulfurifustis variabilis TaxID=1675686 RepID=A0A1B4V3K9_9GAMM|nr:uroporphyrinogen-III synthase [Sulfurifustis variabilis]BAU47082.1 uroporphyrinogen III synthase [Sulfurifustis variabilis]